MNTPRILPVSLLAVCLLAPAPVLAQGRFASSVEIGAVDSLWSASLDEQRHYLVYTPPSYDDEGLSPQRYPVIYLLDGSAHFHSVSGLVQILGTGVNGTYVIPEAIVVAIPNTNRMRDLTPTEVERSFDGQPLPEGAVTGGNPAFFSFLRDELIPRVERDYRTDPYRIFIGHSLGGVTAVNALFTMPEVFDAYVAIDPSLWWDDSLLLRQAREVLAERDFTGKALYVAQANTLLPDDSVVNRHFSDITQFDVLATTHADNGLRYAFEYYKEDSHGSVPLIAEYDALRFIFQGYDVPLQRVLEDPPLLEDHFRRFSARMGAEFGPTEGMLRLLAGASLQQQESDAARAFAQMRVRRFPESAGAHEFLGDVLAGQGATEDARAHYQRALALDPDDDGVREKLAGLEGDGG